MTQPAPSPNDPFWDEFASRLGTDEMQDAINRRGDQTADSRDQRKK